jgi:transcription elongation factor/antiterminator RfaH
MTVLDTTGSLVGAVSQEFGGIRRDNQSLSAVESGRWFVVHTQPRRESFAIEHLHRQGFGTFCPMFRRTIRHARKRTTVLSALFPNYVFVQFDPSRDQWRCINGTRGVVRLISHHDVPSMVPAVVVVALQQRLRDDGAMDWTTTLAVGEAVKVIEGPFADLIGTLERLDACGRVRVLLDLLGRSVSVVMSGQIIAPAH